MTLLARGLAPAAPGVTLFPFRPVDATLRWTLLAMLLGSGLIALSAQVSVGIPVGPVPITGQTFGVLLVGAALGSRLGAATVAAYLLEGVAGLPVFSNGTSGWAVMSGQTGGYLVGFVAAAWMVGLLAERGWDRTVTRTVVAMALGNLVIYAFGVARLQAFIGWPEAWSAGVEPFLPGAAVKVLLAAGALPGAWWLRRRLLGVG